MGDGTSALCRFRAQSGSCRREPRLQQTSPALAELGAVPPHPAERQLCPRSPLRPAFPLASLMPAESYNEFVDRCAVSVTQMLGSCPQDGKCAQVRAAPAGGGSPVGWIIS